MDLCDSQHTGENPSPDSSDEEKQQNHNQKQPIKDHPLPQNIAPTIVEMIGNRYPQYPLKSMLAAALKHLQSIKQASSETVNHSSEKLNEPIQKVTQLDEKKEIPALSVLAAVPVRRRGRPPKIVKEANGQPLSRETRERKIAQIYIESGYGIGPAKQQAGFDLDMSFYYSCMRNIMYGAFKKLQNIAQTICRVNVQQSEQTKSQKFKNQLCKCDKWMSADELSTFQEYIKSVYDLQPRAVSKGQTVRLFNSLISHWSKVPH